MTPEELRLHFPQAPESFIRRNSTARTLPAGANVPMEVVADIPQPGKKRLRQHQGDGLNKTEREFGLFMRQGNSGATVLEQRVTLLLANGVRYTPDLLIVSNFYTFADPNTFRFLRAYEVKGFMREDAAVKLKVAASAFPWIVFHLATKKKKKDGGGWSIQEILP